MKETNKSLELYRQYERMGKDRSLAKLADQLGRPASYVRHLQLLSSEHSWQDRVRSYDAAEAREIDDARRSERVRSELEKQEIISRMNQEHSLLGRTHALRAAKQIQDLIDVKKFGSQAAVNLLKIATDLERVARGAETATTRVVQEQPRNTIAFDLTILSVEQLERLEQIAGELEPGDES